MEESIGKKEFDTYKIPLWIISGLNAALFLVFLVAALFGPKFPFTVNWAALYIWGFVGFLPAFIPRIFHPLFELIADRLKKRQSIPLRGILSLLIAGVSLFFTMVFAMILAFSEPMGSRTDNIDHYLVVDNEVLSLGGGEFFPQELPDSARNVRYHYGARYDKKYDLYCRMVLSEGDYEAEWNRIFEGFPDAEVVYQEDGAIKVSLHELFFHGYDYQFVVFYPEELAVEYVDSYAYEYNYADEIPYYEFSREFYKGIESVLYGEL